VLALAAMGLAMINMSVNRKRKRSLTVLAFTTWTTGEERMSFRGGSSRTLAHVGLRVPLPRISSRRRRTSAAGATTSGLLSWLNDGLEDLVLENVVFEVDLAWYSDGDDIGSGVVDDVISRRGGKSDGEGVVLVPKKCLGGSKL